MVVLQKLGVPVATVGEFNEAKFRELVLYIAKRAQSFELWNVTKLYKILYYADFQAYRKLGQPITSATYLAHEHGPVPEQRGVIFQTMVNAGEVADQQLPPNHHRFIPLREPALKNFSAEEIDIVNWAIRMIEPDSAKKASDRSHEELGWLAAYAEHEATGTEVPIPYETVFVHHPQLDKFDEQRASELARKHQWRPARTSQM